MRTALHRPARRASAGRRLRGTAFAVCLLVGGGVAAQPALAAGRPPRAPRPVPLGPNLVVNPSFEQSALESPPASPNAVTAKQPVLPVGWVFEGATVLFDYNTRGGHTGQRQVAISGALAPGKQACDASVNPAYMCVANPAYAATGPAEESALGVWSVRPYWVSQTALPVVAGKTYRFSEWSLRPSLVPDGGVQGEGVDTKVRWLNSGGQTVSIAQGPVSLKGPKRQLGWQLGAADLVAPAGAVGAKLLLGHTDYLVTSAQVAFDDVAFQQVLR